MFKCSDCSYTSKQFFGLCPSCNEGIGEKIKAPSIPGAGRQNASKVMEYKIERADDKIEKDKVVKKTQFAELNKVLSSSGGLVRDQIVALGAQPGVGKSTLCAQLCNENSLYISTEESVNQVKSRFKRVNPNSMTSILSETNFDSIFHAIESTEADFIILDSLNNINNGSEGYVRQAANLTKINSLLKALGKTAIIISQVTKSGEITGMNTILHTVDTVLYMERSEVSDHVIIGSTKNRFGAIGSVSIFDHDENGLKESTSSEVDTESLIGISLADAKFGFKSMDVVIEALVAPSSTNYGLRRAYGLNISRVQQIIGVLSSNSGIDFSSKDVYVSVSNGLSINDTGTDLAIANSILSSYYQEPSKFKKVVGSLSLNGSIRRSNLGIRHIKEMISQYRGR